MLKKWNNSQVEFEVLSTNITMNGPVNIASLKKVWSSKTTDRNDDLFNVTNVIWIFY